MGHRAHGRNASWGSQSMLNLKETPLGSKQPPKEGYSPQRDKGLKQTIIRHGIHLLSVSQSVSLVAQSCATLWLHGLKHTRLPSLSPTPGACPNSCPSSWWCHPAISSSVVPFSPCLQSFPASGSFQMSPFLVSGGQSTGVSASASVLLMNIQDWFPLGWAGWISLHSKGLSRVFYNTTVQKHQFFGIQLSL